MSAKFDQFPYKKLLFISSFLQLALGVILYMLKSINTPVLAIMAGASLLCLLLGALWHCKASRVIARVFAWAIPAVMLTFSLLLVLFLDISNLVAYFGFSIDLLAARLFLLAIYMQTPLLIFIPSIAVLAHAQQKRMDIFLLRLYALLQLALSVVFVIVIETNIFQDLGIKNTYYNLFYIAICMLTALCALASFPIKTKWLNGLLNKPISNRKDQTSK